MPRLGGAHRVRRVRACHTRRSAATDPIPQRGASIQERSTSATPLRDAFARRIVARATHSRLAPPGSAPRAVHSSRSGARLVAAAIAGRSTRLRPSPAMAGTPSPHAAMLAGRAPSRSSRPRPLPVARRHRAFAAARRILPSARAPRVRSAQPGFDAAARMRAALITVKYASNFAGSPLTHTTSGI